MHRLLIPLLALVAVVVTTPTVASAQENTVAILGLEVLESGGKIDMTATKLAAALTSELRKRASVGKGPFRLAPNSNKELLEMKLLGNCEDAGKKCMAEIGKGFGASHTLYGNVKKTGDGYKIELQLLNNGNATIEQNPKFEIPLADASGSALGGWAKSIYNRISGIPEDGAIVVTSNVPTGTIMVDGEVATSLSAGQAKISGLSVGEHEITLEAAGYRKGTRTVQVTAVSDASVNIDLEEISSISSSPSSPGSTSRILFWSSVAVAAAGVALAGVSYGQFNTADGKVHEIWDRQGADSLRRADKCALADSYDPACAANTDIAIVAKGVCDNVDNPGAPLGDNQPVNDLRGACNDGEKFQTLHYAGLGVGVAAGLAAGFFFYKGYISSSSGSEQESTAVRVVPSFSPTSVGAGVSIDF